MCPFQSRLILTSRKSGNAVSPETIRHSLHLTESRSNDKALMREVLYKREDPDLIRADLCIEYVPG